MAFRKTLALAGALAYLAVRSSAQVGVYTQHNDNERTGAYLHETRLNANNVNGANFGLRFTRNVSGQIYAQPLYAPNIRMRDGRVHNIVVVATASNNVYAFDADDPNQPNPIWHISAGQPFPARELPGPCGDWDMKPWIGIASTPVIDPATNTLYFTAKTQESWSGARHHAVYRLHAVDLSNGAAKFGGPTVLSASAWGNDGGERSRWLGFDPYVQLQRPGLLLVNGVVYLAFGAHCDQDRYRGWVLGYNARNVQQQMAAHCTAPDGYQSGIWQAGGGISSDNAGGIYYSSGNGDSNALWGGNNFGESIVRLNYGLHPVDWFTPHHFDFLNDKDLDLGTSSPVVIPNSFVVIGGGKEGILYVLARNNLGHYWHTGDNHIVQTFQLTKPGSHIHSPAYWKDRPGGPALYVWGEYDFLRVFPFFPGSGTFSTSPSQVVPSANGGHPGTMLSISANGGVAGTGLLWANFPTKNANWDNGVPAIFRVFDASNVNRELYSYNLGNFAKFCPPTIANGKVYMGTFSDKLHVFGLRPGAGNIGVNNASGRVGQAVLLSARLQDRFGSSLAGKTLNFYVEGGFAGSAATDGTGRAAVSYTPQSGLGGGNHTIQVTFAGDYDDWSCSGTGTLTVARVDTFLSVNSVAGEPGATVDLSASLRRAGDNSALSGRMITFRINGGTIGSAVTSGVGTAVFRYTIPESTPAGAQSIGCAFDGDSGYNGSAGKGTLTVQKSATALRVSDASGQGGDRVTLQGTLTRGVRNAPYAGATLTFQVDGANAGSAQTAGSGVASLTYTIPEGMNAGNHTVHVVFAGDAGTNGSAGNGTLTVANADTQLLVMDTAGQIGDTVEVDVWLFRASNGLGQPNRSIAVQIDGISIGSAMTDTNGVAYLYYTIPDSLGAGNHRITATFAGGQGLNGTTGSGSLNVARADAQLQVADSAGQVGDVVELDAFLLRTSTGVTLSGKTLAFQVDGLTAGSAVTDGTGRAFVYFTVPDSLGAGNHRITATFAGDAANSAASGAGSLLVSRVDMVLLAFDTSGVPGYGVVLSAYAVRANGSGRVSGTLLTFKVNGAVVGSATTDESGFAWLDYAIPDTVLPGTYPITVEYAGDAHASPASARATLTVDPL